MCRKVLMLMFVIVLGISFGFAGCNKNEEKKMDTMQPADSMKKDDMKKDTMKKDNMMKKDDKKM